MQNLIPLLDELHDYVLVQSSSFSSKFLIGASLFNVSGTLPNLESFLNLQRVNLVSIR